MIYKLIYAIQRNIHIIIGFVVLVGLGVWITNRTTVEMNLRARDWRTLTLATESRSPSAPSLGRYGGGQVRGYTQYVSTHSMGINDDGKPKGVILFTAKDTIVTIIDISSMKISLAFDNIQNIYQLSLYSTNTPNQNQLLFEFPNSFSELPETLQQHIIYQSPRSETLQLTYFQGLRSPTYTELGIISGTTSRFEWNLRENCLVTVSRRLDLFSLTKNRVYLEDQCDLNTISHLSQGKSQEKVFNFWAGAFAIMTPSGYQITADNMVTPIETDSGKYLLILDTLDALDQISGTVPSEKTFLSLSLSSEFNNANFSTPLTIQPLANSIEFEGPLGNLKIGLTDIPTSELTSLSVVYDSLPSVSLENSTIVTDLGQLRQIQVLQTKSLVSSVQVNGIELVQNRWQEIPVESQGAIIGAIVGVIITLLTNLLFQRKSAKDNAINEVKPIIQTMPIASKKDNDNGRTIFWIGFTSILMILTLLKRKK